MKCLKEIEKLNVAFHFYSTNNLGQIRAKPFTFKTPKCSLELLMMTPAFIQ